MEEPKPADRRISWPGIGTGIVLVLSSAAHAFLGWPQLVPVLEETGVHPEVIAALAVGWYFGSMAMLAFGLIALRIGIRTHDRRSLAADVCWIIAAGYLLFGTGAYVLRDFNPHFLLFVFTGILLSLVALSLTRRSRRSPEL